MHACVLPMFHMYLYSVRAQRHNVDNVSFFKSPVENGFSIMHTDGCSDELQLRRKITKSIESH